MELPITKAADIRGKVVFLNPTSVYQNETEVPFADLNEMMAICSNPPQGLSLDHVVISGHGKGECVTLTLGLVSMANGVAV